MGSRSLAAYSVSCSIAIFDLSATCIQPAAFDVYMNFDRSCSRHIDAAHDTLRRLGLHGHLGGGGAWYGTCPLDHEFARGFRDDLRCALKPVFLVFLFDHAVPIQVILNDAFHADVGCRLAGPGLHGLLKLGTLFRRHLGQHIGRYEHTRRQSRQSHFPSAGFGVERISKRR
jgi:hypothetical protein